MLVVYFSIYADMRGFCDVIATSKGGGSYAVAVDGAEVGAATSPVLPENVVLPVGTVGHVTGLKAEHYNGQSSWIVYNSYLFPRVFLLNIIIILL